MTIQRNILWVMYCVIAAIFLDFFGVHPVLSFVIPFSIFAGWLIFGLVAEKFEDYRRERKRTEPARTYEKAINRIMKDQPGIPREWAESVYEAKK